MASPWSPGDHRALGDEYASSVPLDKRRETGLVYTPEHLVRFTLQRAGYRGGKTNGHVLLDPACGAGAFLKIAAEVLVENLIATGSDPRTHLGRLRMLRLLEATLFGIDLDPHAVRLAQEAVRGVATDASKAAVPSSFFARNVITSDFVLGEEADGLGPTTGFSLIVGNPPYVPAVRLTAAVKDRLRRRYRTARGRIDLYTVFIERSLELLGHNGRLAFITSDKFLASETSQELRRFLISHGSVRTLARFRSHRVFKGAAAVPSILVYEKGRPSRNFTFVECGARPRRGRVHLLGTSKMAHSVLTDGPWIVRPPSLEKIAREIASSHPRLRDFVSRCSAGVATGLDSLYVVSADSPIESDLLRPAIRGRDIGAYRITDPGLRLLIPYVFTPFGPKLVDLDDFPQAARYLAARRSDLERRHCVRVWEKRWWDVHDPVPCNVGGLAKIVVPDVCSHNRFAYDEGQFWPLHSAYYLVATDIDPHYLTAVLNSRPLEFLIRLRAPIVKDGFSRYRKQFLMDLPVPRPGSQPEARIAEMVKTGNTMAAEYAVEELIGFHGATARGAQSFLSDLRKTVHD
jgi:adenine-specific DNA-methyltransferase